jgi:hypothetical protein
VKTPSEIQIAGSVNQRRVLASMGVVWIALMTLVSTAFYMLTRNRQIAA